MNGSDEEDNSPSVVSTRTMEIVTSVILLVLSLVVIQDSLRVGAGWAESEGPRAGYFPFYIGIFLGIAALVTLVKTILAGRNSADQTVEEADSFVSANAGQTAEEAESFVSATALR